MPLRIKVGNKDKVMINGAVIENDGEGTTLVIHNRVDILRRKEILQQSDANTPSRLIYYAIQCAYMFREDRERFVTLARDYMAQYLAAAASARELLTDIDALIEKGEFYLALRKSDELIAHENTRLNP